ncbi:MAG: choice-of-anchor Q domain-containing protein [Gemmataceae bacterium]
MFTSRRARFARTSAARSLRARATLWLVALEERQAPANLVVTDAGDNGGPGQLRAVLATADNNNQPDTISFASNVTTVTLTSALPAYGEIQTLTITGNGQVATTIVAPPNSRIFYFDHQTAIELIKIEHLTLTGANMKGTGPVETGNGGAVRGRNVALMFDDVLFSQNTANSGGAISFSSNCLITNCTFSGNSALGNGGAIDCTVGSATISSSTFINNGGSNYSIGGAISSLYQGDLVLDSDTFTSNTAGAVCCSGPFNITNSTFSGNRTNKTGAALYLRGIGSVAHCSFTGNSAIGSGGAIDQHGSATISNDTFTNNSSNNIGGAINNVGPLTVSNSVFSGNVATTGGAIYSSNAMSASSIVFSNNRATANGGAINLKSDATINFCDFNANTAAWIGGGLDVGKGTLTINNSTFRANTAGLSGGGLRANAMVTINQSTFSKNTAAGGAGGGAIVAASTATLNINNSTISDNTASSTLTSVGGGGILRSDPNASITLYSTIVAGNKVGAGANNADFYNSTTSFTLNGNNSLFGTTTNMGVTLTGPYVVGNPLLNALADNGGFMLPDGNHIKTMAPQAGSPAIDQGNNSAKYFFDQRDAGLIRQRSLPDIGAFEAPSTAPDATLLSATAVPASGTANYSFSVKFSDDNAVDTSTILPGNIAVSGPGFTGQSAIATSFIGSGTSVTATYTIPAPVGGWGGLNLANTINIGSYSISINANQVAELNGGKYVAAGPLGNFQTGFATVFTVDNTGDITDGNYGMGQLSLREAIGLANSNSGVNTISFNLPPASTITLASGFTLTQSVIISGPGPNLLAINGNNKGRHFTIAPNQVVAISGLKLVGGSVSTYGGAGGAVLMMGADRLTLINDWLAGNFAYNGGAIGEYPSLTACQLTIQNGLLTNNSSTNSGGSVLLQDGMLLSISNSTLANNTATRGGAICGSTLSSGSITIRNSTIFNNSASLGAALNFTEAGYSPGILSLESTIVSNDTPAYYAISGPVGIGWFSEKTSVIQSCSGAALDLGGNLPIGTDPQLGPLTNNGGVLPTLALLPGSPAIDAGSNPDALIYDQRGTPYLRTNGSKTDMGAYEYELPPTVTSVPFGTGTSRSLVKQLIVTFSEPVSFMGSVASAFTVHRTGTNGTLGDVALTTSPSSGPASSVTITFSGSLTEYGSLVDGLYDVWVDAAQVSGVGGALDGNNDGIAGGSYHLVGTTVNKVYRLFGDGDGNATVDQYDFPMLRNAIAGPSVVFDFDGSGEVGQADYLAFRERIGMTP